jgi:hypothetical protein
MQPDNPDALLDRALTALPVPRAPHTLLPRVLAAARSWTERPWYTRAWLMWPVAWQAASVAALALLLALGAWMAPSAGTALSQAVSAVPRAHLTPLADIAQQTEGFVWAAAAFANAIWAAWRAVMLPGVVYGFGLLGLMCAACAAFSATLSRLAIGKALSR